jgi:hypothetical protein
MSVQVTYAGLILQDDRSGDVQIHYASPLGQTFTAEDSHIEKIAFYILDYNPDASPDDHDLIAELYSGVGNNGTLIASNTVDNIEDGHAGWLYFDFRLATLNIGEMYSIFIIDDSIRWGVGRNNPLDISTDYVGGYEISLGTVRLLSDLTFMVVSIPEPCTLTLLAVGGLLLKRRNRN